MEHPSAPGTTAVCSLLEATGRIALPTERTRDRPRPDRRRRSPHVPADHRPPAGLLGGAGLRRRPAVPHRGRRRHLQPRDVPALPGRPSLARRLRRAFHAPRRRALRREPLPPRPLLPVPGGHQAVAGRHPGRVPALARGPRHRPRRARRALRRGQLGGPHARRLGPGLGGLGRRHGGHPVHVLPAAGRLRPRPHHHRDHLRTRAARHVPAGRGQRLRPGVVALGGGRRRARRHLRRRLPGERARVQPLQLRGGGHRDAVPPLPRARGRGAADHRGAPAHPRLRPRAQVQPRLQHARRARRDQRHRPHRAHRPRARPRAQGRRPLPGGRRRRARGASRRRGGRA